MGKQRILIVDDDPDICEAMRIVLEAAGYEVATAGNGEEAMASIRGARPGVIILDVMMNQLREGFFVSRQLKKDPKYKGIPILMLTAVKAKTGLDFKPAAGDEDWLPVEDYLDKPVKPQVLLERVAALLKK